MTIIHFPSASRADRRSNRQARFFPTIAAIHVRLFCFFSLNDMAFKLINFPLRIFSSCLIRFKFISALQAGALYFIHPYSTRCSSSKNITGYQSTSNGSPSLKSSFIYINLCRMTFRTFHTIRLLKLILSQKYTF